jgi:ankyrin repeat protein
LNGPLLIAARGGHSKVVNLLLKANADVNARAVPTPAPCPLDAEGLTPRSAQVQAALKLDYLERTDVTPLMLAASAHPSTRGHAVVIAQLLDAAGTDLHATTRDGWTALMFAQARGNQAVARLLQARIADQPKE